MANTRKATRLTTAMRDTAVDRAPDAAPPVEDNGTTNAPAATTSRSPQEFYEQMVSRPDIRELLRRLSR